MIEINNVHIYNIARAIYSARNPMSSLDKSDSDLTNDIVGEKDLDLARKLVGAGSDHGKFMRQILITMDITSPIYWWKEMDTYRIGTTANSTSTMHTLTKQPLVEDMFSVEDLDFTMLGVFRRYVSELEALRLSYNHTKNPDTWRCIIQMLPSSFNQTRTWTANYEVLRNIYRSRKNHKLKEWREFCTHIEGLELSELITMINGSKD